MGCNGCGSNPDKKYDARGNVVGTPDMERGRPGPDQPRVAQEARELTYQEYLEKRSQHRAETRAMGDQKVTEFSEDYKRIQIEELVAVYNLDEVHFKLTPNQALVALWEFAHHPVYQKVFDEFEGLREQIDTKHTELMANKLVVKWKP